MNPIFAKLDNSWTKADFKSASKLVHLSKKHAFGSEWNSGNILLIEFDSIAYHELKRKNNHRNYKIYVKSVFLTKLGQLLYVS